MRPARLVVAMALATAWPLVGCGEAVDAPPLGDYTAWTRFDFRGPAPGHGDRYRIVYANAVATQDVPLYLTYPEGAVLVKEVRDDDDGQPGALREVAIMRRIGAAPAALTDDGGWLFSETDRPGGDETHHDSCWATCHAAAPYNGAWYVYRVPTP